MTRFGLCLLLALAGASDRVLAQTTPSVSPNVQTPATAAKTPASPELLVPRQPSPTPEQNPPNAPAPQGVTAPTRDALNATVPQTNGSSSWAPTEILLPHDLSPWSMFLSADILVKAVMIGLAFASLMTWTVFFAKSLEFSFARRRLRSGLGRLEDARSFAEAKLALGKNDRVLAGFLNAAFAELRFSDGTLRDTGIKERVDSKVSELARAESQSMRRGMPLLATIGSTAPFVGLFGTVWGIMNAFIGISKSQTTNLAVVAPGIAEALLATAIGLVAAIPAVVIYNHFSQSGRRYQSLVAQASGSIQRLLSRELDQRAAGAAIRAAE